ncbi:MAG: tetratricopeptide repeat protein [Chloroflexi bacterium]|nr:tetratricopeptide repeat protein [Chloroflexota bacterium]
MTERLDIHLLGGFQLFADSQPVSGLTSLRTQSLLAFLLLRRGNPQPRQRLAFLLWPETSEEQARTNLRKTIHFLRRLLPGAELLISRDGALQWNPDIPLALDTADFEAAAEAGDFGRAVALYIDDLLPNCYDEWILADRERLRQIYLSALHNLVQQHESAGDYAAALGYALRLLQSDPLREDTHRLVMRLHALNGDRAAVLHAYQNCATLLKRELGIDPSPATRQVYERLLDHPETQSKALTLIGGLPLIGRQPAWDRLLEAWRSSTQGKAQMVLISGEPGIGKTRLAEELLEWVARQGISCASTHCYAAEGSLAYAPLVGWLRERPIANLAPVWQAEIARLIPEVSGGGAQPAKPVTLAEPWQRRRFYEALAHAVLEPDLIMALPLLFLIDDLQWSDPDTLEWLHYLLHFNPRARLLVVGTLRQEAVQSGDQLPVLLTDLRKHSLLTEIELAPLSPEETSRLGQQAAGSPLDAGQSANLYSETEGNPLFIIEFARLGLAQAGEMDASAGAQLLPRRVLSAVNERLTQLTPSTRRVMELAAAIGRDFTYEVLRRANGEGENILIEALDELWHRGLIRERQQGGYDFSHEILRQVVYMNLSAVRRQMLHRRIAQALEEMHTGYPEAASGHIARHYKLAGDHPRAAAWLRKAAEASAGVGAFSDAIHHLTQALELTPPEDLEDRFSLMLSREKLNHLRAARLAQATDLQELEQLSLALEDGHQEGVLRRLQVALESGSYLSEISDFPGAIAAAQTALALVDLARERAANPSLSENHLNSPGQLPRLEVQAWVLWGASLEYQGNYAEAMAPEAKALELARAAGLRHEEAGALCALARSTPSVPAAREYLEAALPIHRQEGDKPGECASLDALGYALLWLGEYESSLKCYTQSLQISRQIGFRRGEVKALFHIGHFYDQVGDYTPGRLHLEEALAMARADRDQRQVAYLLFNISVNERSTGHPKTARKYAQEALAICKKIGDQNGEINAWIILGDACTDLGQWDEAEAAFRRGLDRIQAPTDPSGAIYGQIKLTRALLGQGKIAEAFSYVEEILHVREGGGSLQGTDEGPIPVYMGCYRVLRQCGDPRAGQVLEEAHSFLQEQAARIQDEAMRRTFIENKRENRELLEAWRTISRQAE